MVSHDSGHPLATAFQPELTADNRFHPYFLDMVGK
jgi:glutamine amidotransferase PdxT